MLAVDRLVNFINVVSVNVFISESSNLQLDYLFLFSINIFKDTSTNFKNLLDYVFNGKKSIKNISIDSMLE